MLMNGEVLGGRYLVEALVAKGGMGAVYRVRDTRLNHKLWAVKEIMVDPATGGGSFLEEVRILCDLSHPYILKVTDYFEPDAEGKCYLVMEYINGHTLQEVYADQKSPITVQLALKYAIQLCEILNYLHEQPNPVIYRDLKPSNIMADEHGNLKLIDFGIARTFKEGQLNDTVALGTLVFAAPEQLENRQTDIRTDLYSLGATLYFLLTGGRYYSPLHSTFELLTPEIPYEYMILLKKLLETQPDQRFQNAREVKKQLETIAAATADKAHVAEPTILIHHQIEAFPVTGTLTGTAAIRGNYTIQATQSTPALIIYLIDISASMGMEMNDVRRIDVVKKALISAIKQMVYRSTKGSRIAPRYRIAILAYSDEVYDMLGGIKAIDEIAGTATLPELTPQRFTDTARAFKRAEELLREELPRLQKCPAPLVCHMTDGAHTGEDPEPIARRIMEMSVADGPVLIENIFINDSFLEEPVKDPRLWKGVLPGMRLGDEYAHKLQNMSSPLPESYRAMMTEFSYSLQSGALMLLPGSSPEMVSLGFQMSSATPIR